MHLETQDYQMVLAVSISLLELDVFTDQDHFIQLCVCVFFTQKNMNHVHFVRS